MKELQEIYRSPSTNKKYAAHVQHTTPCWRVNNNFLSLNTNTQCGQHMYHELTQTNTNNHVPMQVSMPW